MLTNAITGLIIILSTFTRLSVQECFNENGRTACRNIAPLTADEPLVFDDYLPELEVVGYTGPLTTSMFQNFPDLEELAFSYSNITAVEDEVFCSLPKLKFINIHYCKFPNITVDTFGSCCRVLHTLVVEQTAINDIASDSFQYLNELRILSVQHGNLTMIHRDAFIGLTNLHHLSLKGNRITDIEDGAFKGLTNLKILNLNYNKLSTVSFEEFRRLITLEDLYLSVNEIMHFDAHELMKYLRQLAFISFYYNRVSCDHLVEIRALMRSMKVAAQVFQEGCPDDL